MIFVDTSVLLCLVTMPTTSHDVEMKRRARALLEGIERGEVRAAIGEVVLHEFCYVSGSKRLNRLDVPTLCSLLRSLLNWPGWEFDAGEKTVYYRALDILQADPRLEFSDAVIAARAEAVGAELATFDRRLANAYAGIVWS